MHPLIAQLLARAGAFLPADMPAGLAAMLTPGRGRNREPNHRADERRRDGIPHGTPGAKLARKAAAGELTLCHAGLHPNIKRRYPFSAKR